MMAQPRGWVVDLSQLNWFFVNFFIPVRLIQSKCRNKSGEASVILDARPLQLRGLSGGSLPNQGSNWQQGDSGETSTAIPP
jgi:hypothetical protein